MLMSATGLTAEDVNDAVVYLKHHGAVETFEHPGTYPYSFGDVRITVQGKYLYHEIYSGTTNQPVSNQEASKDELAYDCFICHASEDKIRFVNNLASSLRSAGCTIWYDEFVLKVGDSLRRKIDEGLRKSRHGVVVLSPSFFKKEWPQKELDGLAALSRERGILPVWLDVTKEDIKRFSPTLADIVAVKASDGLETVVEGLLEAMNKQLKPEIPPVLSSNVTQAALFTRQEAELLAAAAQDGKLNRFERLAQMATGWVRVGRKNFVDKVDPAVAVEYIEALESLVTKGYVKYEGGILYVLTGSGFKAAREIANQTWNDKKR
jgi:hypothetical protein